MTKFEELCQAYTNSRKYYFDYRDSCYQFTGGLMGKISSRLGIPMEQLEFIPLKEEPKPNTKYSISGAMHLDDDTYWHIGIRITLYEKPNILPHQPVLVRILIKKKDNIFTVRLGPAGEVFPIRQEVEEEYNTFIDAMFSLIKNGFETGLQRFLEKREIVKKIGFDIST